MAYPRSPYDREGGLYYFPRMLHKMRMYLSDELPEDYQKLRSKGLDGMCCTFLQVNYDDALEQVKNGKSDAEVLVWCFENGHNPSEHDIKMYNDFMSKRGWRDSSSEFLEKIVSGKERGWGYSQVSEGTLTFFDLIDADEDRR